MDESIIMDYYKNLFGGEDDAADKADLRQEREDLHRSDELPAQGNTEIPEADHLEGMGKGPSEPSSSPGVTQAREGRVGENESPAPMESGHNTEIGIEEQRPSSILLPRLLPKVDSEGTLHSLPCNITRVVKAIGVPSAHIGSALVITTALVSAPLQNPIAVLLVGDEGSCEAASWLLSKCMELAPEQYRVELMNLKPGTLYQYASDFTEKTVVAANLKGIKTSLPEIVQMIERSAVTDSRVDRNKGMQRSTVKDCSWIIVAYPKEAKLLEEHRVIKIPVSFDAAAQKERTEYELAVAADPKIGVVGRMQAKQIAKQLERVPVKRVVIPYTGQLKQPLANLPIGPSLLYLNMTRLMTLMRHCRSSITGEEIYADYLGLEKKDCEALMGLAGGPLAVTGATGTALPGDASASPAADVLVANKVDAHYARELLKDLLDLGPDRLTAHERRVFEAVQGFNREVVKGNFFVSREPTEAEMMNTLMFPDHDRCWATHIQIKLALQKDGGAVPGRKKIDQALTKLQADQLIMKRKSRINPNEFLYAATTFDAVEPPHLPDPRLITDDEYHGQRIKVLNPVTLMEEEI